VAKADLLKEAKRLGLDVTAKNTVTEIESAISALHDPNAGARHASPENPCPVCGRMNGHVHNIH